VKPVCKKLPHIHPIQICCDAMVALISRGLGMHELFAQHAPSIEKVIAGVCRSLRLPSDKAEDFAQDVRLHLLQRPNVLESFRGGSNFQTYLFRVIRNYFLNWHSKNHGRWRPSRRAQRLGKVAIALEKLVDRYGMKPVDAIDQLVSDGVASRPTLSELPEAVPRRTRLRGLRTKALSTDSPAHLPTFERAHDAALIQSWIKEALRQLSPIERELLKARFCASHCANAAAVRHGMSLSQFYARVQRILARLRGVAFEAGIDRDLAASLIDCRALLEFNVMDSDAESSIRQLRFGAANVQGERRYCADNPSER